MPNSKAKTVMVFGATVDSASYRYPGHWYGSIDEEASKREIDAMVEMGIDFFRIDVRSETLGYAEEMKKLDNIVTYGRSKGLRVYFGVFGMETWMASWLDMFWTYPNGGGGKASWDDFRKMYTGEVDTIMNRYKPDYIMIIPEARRNIGNQVNSVRTVDEWVIYTKELAAKIKNISPSTKVVLNEVVRSEDKNSSVDYVGAIMKDNDKNIDIIGIDPYSPEELNDEMSTVTRLAERYKWHGRLRIGETNIFNVKDDDYQKKYFETAIDLAIENNFEGFVVFYFRDIPGQTDKRGILNNDFSKKPAYEVINKKIESIRQSE
ncbi:MAG: hypothetical protein WC788_08440 [Candidatus Paceibacterota bacterium]